LRNQSQGDRLNQEQIDKYNNYREAVIPKYTTAQPKEEIEVSSEYFLYKKILEKDKKQDLRICNVGAHYWVYVMGTRNDALEKTD